MANPVTPNPLRELARLARERFDAPRFCRDDGEEIEVENVERYDERTGDRKDRWVWHCPNVRVSFDGGRVTWSQWGADGVHEHGFGRPRWHALAALDAVTSQGSSGRGGMSEDGPSADGLSFEDGLSMSIQHLTFRLDQAAAEDNGGRDHTGVNDLFAIKQSLLILRASIWPDRYELPHGRRPL